MPRNININHAVVHTATVEIKTLVVDKKQVTLNLFRQFPERSIFDPRYFNLEGTPWGLVNYKWKEIDFWCDKHLVWSTDKRLYRMSLPGKDFLKFMFKYHTFSLEELFSVLPGDMFWKNFILQGINYTGMSDEEYKDLLEEQIEIEWGVVNKLKQFDSLEQLFIGG